MIWSFPLKVHTNSWRILKQLCNIDQQISVPNPLLRCPHFTGRDLRYECWRRHQSSQLLQRHVTSLVNEDQSVFRAIESLPDYDPAVFVGAVVERDTPTPADDGNSWREAVLTRWTGIPMREPSTAGRTKRAPVCVHGRAHIGRTEVVRFITGN